MMRRTCFVVLFALALAGCQDPPPAPPKEPSSNKAASAAKDSFPGHDPPPLAELLKAAEDKAKPDEAPEPYAPRTVEVPELQPDHPEILPKNASGKPLLTEQSGAAQLTVDETLSDPITARATCMQLTTSCIQTPDTPDRRDRDSCVHSAATCTSNHPWDEAAPCCPSSCKELYEKLRKDGYSMRDGWMLVRTSDCFPALPEFVQAAREADEKAAAQESKP